MKRTLFPICLCILSIHSIAQSFGIGTDSPSPNAILEVQSIEKGILIPRMTTVQRSANLAGLAATDVGLLIYNTTMNEFNYWDGNAWISFPSAGGGNDGDWTNTGGLLSPTDGISEDVSIGTTTAIGKLTVTDAVDNNRSAIVVDRSSTTANTNGVQINSSVSNGGAALYNDMDNSISPAAKLNAIENDFTGITNPSFAPNSRVSGVYNNFDVSVEAEVSGLENSFDGNNIQPKIGMINNFELNSYGTKYGMRSNFISNTGSGNKYGAANYFSTNRGGFQYGFYNEFSGTASNDKFGLQNSFLAGTGGVAYGVQNVVETSSTSRFYGYDNYFNTTGTGIKTGYRNLFEISCIGTQIGFENFFYSTDTRGKTGFASTFHENSAGGQNGVFIAMNSNGAGRKTAYTARFGTTALGQLVGMNIDLSGQSTDGKTGVQVVIPNTGGTSTKHAYNANVGNAMFDYAAYFIGKQYISSQLGIGQQIPSFALQLGTNSAAKPTSSVWTVASDKRLKKDIKPFTDGLDLIQKIRPVWFTYNGEAEMPDETGVGTIAQELHESAPYMVRTWEYTDSTTQSKKEYLGVDYGAMDFVLINAIKEQQKMIEEQQGMIETLEAKNESFLTIVHELKTQLLEIKEKIN